MPDWEIRQGDCLALMADMEPGSVDAVVTDPPYGLTKDGGKTGFMGAAWDGCVPGVPFWAEALRVAKPGAHLLAFGGTRTFHRLAVAIEDAGWEIRDTLSWLYGEGFPKSHNGPWGGTALKPAWEPIVMARKPLRGTVAANYEAFGTGALNIDGCRIEGEAWIRPAGLQPEGKNGIATVYDGGPKRRIDQESSPLGRWPANVCLDECAAAELDRQSGESVSRVGKPRGAASGDGWGMTATGAEYADTGGASRFFYVAKPDRAERDMGILLPLVQGSAVTGRALDSAGALASAYAGTTQAERRNTHPTVKPVALMRWLCRLVTPPGGLILDPFCGSGTTGVAAVGEGFRFLGMELEPRFVEISRARIANTQLPLLRLHDLAPEEGATR